MKAVDIAVYTRKNKVSFSFDVSDERYKELIGHVTGIYTTIGFKILDISPEAIALDLFFNSDFEFKSIEEFVVAFRELLISVQKLESKLKSIVETTFEQQTKD